MNVQLPVHMDKAAFLAWVQGLEGRYELANGRVVMPREHTRSSSVTCLRCSRASLIHSYGPCLQISA
jgi:hypothetical protein